jgi:hypothetical protein
MRLVIGVVVKAPLYGRYLDRWLTLYLSMHTLSWTSIGVHVAAIGGPLSGMDTQQTPLGSRGLCVCPSP